MLVKIMFFKEFYYFFNVLRPVFGTYKKCISGIYDDHILKADSGDQVVVGPGEGIAGIK